MKMQFFFFFYCATRCAFLCAVLCSVVNFVVHFCLMARENKLHIVMYPKIHFVVIYIFEYTFSRFYILLCLQLTLDNPNTRHVELTATLCKTFVMSNSFHRSLQSNFYRKSYSITRTLAISNNFRFYS